jgi:hypothetical protein
MLSKINVLFNKIIKWCQIPFDICSNWLETALIKTGLIKPINDKFWNDLIENEKNDNTNKGKQSENS